MTDPWADKGFGWKNMFVSPEVDPRGDASPTRGEREMLVSYLRFQRQTLELKKLRPGSRPAVEPGRAELGAHPAGTGETHGGRRARVVPAGHAG